MESYLERKRPAILISLFCMALWGSAIPLIKTTYRLMGITSGDTGAKLLVAGIRFCFAGLIGLGYYALLNRGQQKKQANYRYICVLSLLQTTLQYIFYYIGLSNTTGVKASIIQSSNAFFIVIISAMVMKSEHLTGRRLLSLLVGTIGIIFANLHGGTSLSFHFRGEGFILIAALFNAMATVFVRKYGKNEDAALSTGIQFFLGSLPLLGLGLILCKQWPEFSFVAILMLVYGGFVSATAFTLWSMVLRHQSSGEFGMYRLFIPIFGSLFSVIFLKETFYFSLLVGLTLVLLGSLILNLPQKK